MTTTDARKRLQDAMQAHDDATRGDWADGKPYSAPIEPDVHKRHVRYYSACKSVDVPTGETASATGPDRRESAADATERLDRLTEEAGRG